MRAEPTLVKILAERLPSDYSRREFFRLLAATGLAGPLIGAQGLGTAAADTNPLATPRKLLDSFYTLNNCWTPSTR